MKRRRKCKKIKEDKANKALHKEKEKQKEYGITSDNTNEQTQASTIEGKDRTIAIKLIDFEEEEERDSKAVKLFLTRYHKPLKFLFDKYASTSYSKKPENFNQLEERATTISVAELLKLMKDASANIKSDEIKEIIRLLLHRCNKIESKSLTLDQFKEFYAQVAIVIGEKNCIPRPFVYYLAQLMQSIIEGAKKRSENAIVLENPEATSLGDADVLKELNKQIIKAPNMELPTGYAKVEIKQIKYMHKMPGELGIYEGTNTCSLILDDIISNALGIHFVEPYAYIETEIKVLPKVVKPDKNRMKPKFLESKDKVQETTTQEVATTKKEPAKKPRVPLSPNIKILIAKIPNEDRSTYEECAYALEEVLFALENGNGDIEKAKQYLNPKLKNNRMKEIEDAKGQKAKEDMEKEKKRKERQAMLKKLIDEKAKKAEEESIQNRKKENEDNKKAKEEKKKQVENIQKMLEEKKIAKEEQKKEKGRRRKEKDRRR